MWKQYGIKAALSREMIIETERDFIKAIKSGKIFVYPTDTVYGIGCNALDKKPVGQVYKIKKRSRNKPLSVIAPSKEWILKNFYVELSILDEYFPGPYTLILKKKRKNFLSNVSKGLAVGVRLPDCALSALIQKSQLPFVTTSANISGNNSAGSLKDVDFAVLNAVDIILEGQILSGNPSTIVNLIEGTKIDRR